MEYNYSEHQRWVQDNGDKTHRINYNLSTESIVVDAGGYQGNWSQEILEKYGSRIFILEPMDNYYSEINRKFKNREMVSVYNYGLASKNTELLISLDDDSSSLYKPGRSYQKIEVKTFDQFIEEAGITKIDLFKINIEGAEYELLDDILEKKIQSFIENIQVQFHVFIPNCIERRNKIREELSKTHECTYNYEFIWENWRKKEC
jgi:FkbM family methyltransferase